LTSGARPPPFPMFLFTLSPRTSLVSLFPSLDGLCQHVYLRDFSWLFWSARIFSVPSLLLSVFLLARAAPEHSSVAGFSEMGRCPCLVPRVLTVVIPFSLWRPQPPEASQLPQNSLRSFFRSTCGHDLMSPSLCSTIRMFIQRLLILRGSFRDCRLTSSGSLPHAGPITAPGLCNEPLFFLLPEFIEG